ncbi:substrate-binding domain-containing protein [Deltaproteobacteria bacterium OttesenSCG-928-M10]|nr:substrate-binding domain-containing protein [Deltaproteobacteria bacterium OttesenSCG-928-M10]
MKRTALLLACIFAGYLIFSPLLRARESPADSDEKIKIGVSVPMAVHGWTGAVVWWAKDEIVKLSEKYPNVEFIFVTANNPEKQVRDLRAMMGQKVKGLVVLPISDEPLAGILKEAYGLGIFIVAVDRISPQLSRDVLVTADNPAIGRMSGEFLAKAIDGKGKIVIMEALPSSINTMRVEGFKEVMARYPGIEILDSQHVNWNPVTGLEVMEKFLAEHPHLDAIWTGDDSVLIRVLQVYEQSGRQDLKLIFGLGGAKEVLKMIMDNHPLVQATINYPATIISDSIRVAVEHVADGRSFPQEIAINCELVNRDNAGLFYIPDSLY